MDFLKFKKKESRLSALHIDDSHWVRIPVSVLLRRHFGMRVFEANSGPEGLLLADREQPDIIILDVMMPNMDGFDTLARLKENEKTKAIPVLMCTARDLAREVNMAVRLGAVGYLTKPIEEEALVSKVKSVLIALGKWGAVAPAHTSYQIPPDLHTDLIVPKDQPAIQKLQEKDDRSCAICHGKLDFIAQYSAWYCHPCRKYPELET